MQAWKILLVLGLVAAVPMVHASDPAGCEQTTGEETVGHPLDPSKYIFLAPTGIEIWSESNGWTGLQRSACFSDAGLGIYDPDTLEDSVALA